ncbi:asparagine--tRNA ligase [Glaciecola petra]|uniref:Asparagine--tRNA ligase n=1 Tax=Glaciecola petra TaxID=3075602 RepID=A0ABU2ZPT9_9ALTE|nr:asparagine--tRNA ligase [Aestuariibacter sp. P117]MDT0594648.1 asparagine--tRNA ligase [Aestuariibacter sp. P117]
MTTAPVAEVLAGKHQAGTTIQIQGWVRTKRDSKAGLSFIAVHDGSCFDPIQVVALNTLDNYNDILRLTTGCSVKASGMLKQSEGKGQSLEIEANSIEILGWVENPDSYPMAAKRHSIEYLREHAHLRPRTNIIGAVTRVRNCLSQAVHRFFHEQGYCWISTPILTASDTEGAGEMFRVSTLDMNNIPRDDKGDVDYSQDFFGKETFLTVSGQLNVETYCTAMSKVYTFGPTFRAENSNTSRHLAEFWMIEPEVAFADLATIAQLSEDLLKYIFKAVLAERADDMAFFEQRVNKDVVKRMQAVVDNDFVRMDYTDAIDILIKSGKKFEFPVEWGIDLSSEHERYLAEEHVGAPIIMQNYPKDIKAFYMRLNDDNKTVAAMDVLAPGIGEIIGGSQREERLDVFDARLKEMNLDAQDYAWYRDLRRYGTVPHAGFGLGFERIVAYVTGVANVRDVIPFPRTPGNANY